MKQLLTILLLLISANVFAQINAVCKYGANHVLKGYYYRIPKDTVFISLDKNDWTIEEERASSVYMGASNIFNSLYNYSAIDADAPQTSDEAYLKTSYYHGNSGEAIVLNITYRVDGNSDGGNTIESYLKIYDGSTVRYSQSDDGGGADSDHPATVEYIASNDTIYFETHIYCSSQGFGGWSGVRYRTKLELTKGFIK